MPLFTFSAHKHSMRFNEDWSEVENSYAPVTVSLGSAATSASQDSYGNLVADGLTLISGGTEFDLEMEPAMLQRIVWGDKVTDVLWIDLHIRASDGTVLGFDSIYIELGGAPLPEFADFLAFHSFLVSSTFGAVTDGTYRTGRDFSWTGISALERIDADPAGGVILGTPNDDLIFGNIGNDVLRGRDGDDNLAGGLGRDRLLGGNGDDTLLGQGSHDRLEGEGGKDLLNGGAGKDTMIGGAERDKMIGGAGADLFVFDLGHGRDRIVDFTTTEGDRLQLSSDLVGGRTAAQVVADLVRVGDGSITLRFSGPDQVILDGVTDPDSLVAFIDIL